jgi:hypothetical protein
VGAPACVSRVHYECNCMSTCECVCGPCVPPNFMHLLPVGCCVELDVMSLVEVLVQMHIQCLL